MPFIYITGVAASGKSTIQRDLTSLGYEAYDADDLTIGAPHNKQTGQPVAQLPLDQRTPEWLDAHEWRLLPEAIANLRRRAADRPLFLCGKAHNERDFWDAFDKVIYLDIDERTLRDRVAARTDNDYGKSESELQVILQRQAEAHELYQHHPDLTIIDATQPLDAVLATILAEAHA